MNCQNCHALQEIHNFMNSLVIVDSAMEQIARSTERISGLPHTVESTTLMLMLLPWRLQGTPAVTETYVDSKKEVDSQLKKTCEDFIHSITEMLIGSLANFLTKVTLLHLLFHVLITERFVELFPAWHGTTTSNSSCSSNTGSSTLTD